ncbi:MAG: YHYH protein, partial [Myxococcota bacterium]
TRVTTRDAALGLAVNGVPMFDYSGGGELSQADLARHQPHVDTIETKQLDNCGGHAGRGDDYHYHAKPTCMIAQMANAGETPILGWAFDGYPIYGDNNPDGTTIPAGSLGMCGELPDDTFGYRYHTSPNWPYTIQCLVGEVAPGRDAIPRVAPLRGPDRRERPPGKPPRGGVENLVLTSEGDVRTMRYRYADGDYYIQYSPSSTPHCYNFEMRTVTNGGTLEKGEYCR